MRLEGSQDFEGRGEDSHSSIEAPNKQVLGPRTDTANLIIVEEGLSLVIWRVNLADLEEIKRLPLS